MTPAEVVGADPGKLIIRLENRLSGLESLRSRSLSEIDQLTSEAAHARDDIARPFPQAGQLAAARDRVARLDEQLRQTAAPSHRNTTTGCSQRPCMMQRPAGIPGAATAVARHQDGQPQSPTELSQSDFPVDNPLDGGAAATGQVILKPQVPTPRARHVT